MVLPLRIANYILHRSNVKNSICEETRIGCFESLSHPSYSPDLAPATIIYSQTSKDGCVLGVLSRTKKMNKKQRDRRHRKIERLLVALYRTKKRVHWEIKPIFVKKINSCSFYYVNINHPSIYIQSHAPSVPNSKCTSSRLLLGAGSTFSVRVLQKTSCVLRS